MNVLQLTEVAINSQIEPERLSQSCMSINTCLRRIPLSISLFASIEKKKNHITLYSLSTLWGVYTQQLKWIKCLTLHRGCIYFWEAAVDVFVFASCRSWFAAASWNSNACYDALLRFGGLLPFISSPNVGCHRQSRLVVLTFIAYFRKKKTSGRRRIDFLNDYLHGPVSACLKIVHNID